MFLYTLYVQYNIWNISSSQIFTLSNGHHMNSVHITTENELIRRRGEIILKRFPIFLTGQAQWVSLLLDTIGRLKFT